MSQRVMIAMAIACNPKLLIADEPTTALDVTIQAQILDLLVEAAAGDRHGAVLITHDMGVVAETAERVIVQYAGQKVEEQTVARPLRDPHHPYTAALLAALPERATGRRLPSIPGVVPGQFDRPRAASSRRAARLRPNSAAPTQPPRIDWRALPLRIAGRCAPQPPAREGEGGMSVVVTATDLTRYYERRARRLREARAAARRWTARASRSSAARRWPSSANRAAASPRSRASSP